MQRMLSFMLLIAVLTGSVVGLGGNAMAESGNPAQPAGNMQAGQPPELPADGMGNLAEGSGIPPDGSGSPPDGMGAPGEPGGMQAENNGTAANTLDADTTVSNEMYSATGDDENALRVENSANVTLSNVTVTKEGSTSNSEYSDFYGLNAGILACDGAALTIQGGTVTTDATGGNGVFSYGASTTVKISDTVIRTVRNNSGGIELAGGGTIEASNLDIETQGNSSAAIRSDRGGGTMRVNGGQYVTNGTGSPAVYSTAEITVANATLIANNSEAVVIEGNNSITLTDCDATGNMKGTYGTDSGENLHTVMIYQSMSGDAEIGHSSFSMANGSLTSLSGDTFYVTNTTCTIELSNVGITNANGNLLTVSGNDASRGWGSEGSNGGTCSLNTTNQALNGAIVVDEISSLTLSMTAGSTFNGTINAGGEAGQISVTLDGNSTWTLTGDSYIVELNGNMENVDTNGFTLYVNGVAL